MGMELQPTEIKSARSGADRREAQVHEFHLFALSDIAEGLAVEPLRDLTCTASVLLGSAEAAPRPLWLAATSGRRR